MDPLNFNEAEKAAIDFLSVELENLAEPAAKKLLQETMPILIKYLQNAVKNNKGLLSGLEDWAENKVIAAANLLLNWANS